MQRVKIILSYDGSLFYGFQRQSEKTLFKTVMGDVEKALSALNIHSPIVGAGRTDTGVHALGQVIHCDIPPFWKDLSALTFHLNTLVHPSIHIKAIEPVHNTFHARFDAQKRLYRYIMYDGVYKPFLANYALHVKSLDISKLHAYAKVLEGSHDFGFFKKEGGGATSNYRTLFKAGAYRYKHLIVLYFLGDAFLRSQVRLMSGMLLGICNGKITHEALVAQRDKVAKSFTTPIPSCGLYLSRIYYLPNAIDLKQRVLGQ